MALPSQTLSSTDALLDQNMKIESQWWIAWRRFRRHRLALVGVVVLLILYLTALFAPVLAPYSPTKIFMGHALAPPSARFPLGTDSVGRDELSRLLYAGRISLTVGLVAAGVALSIGVFMGIMAGFYGRWVDMVIMRFIDMMLAIPSLFLLLIVSTLLRPSIYNIMIIIGLTSWMEVARLVRGQILSERTREYVDAARAMGMNDFRIMLRHLLPNAIAPVIVAGTLMVARAILTESALSFLGLGVQPPIASWGSMLSTAQNYIWGSPMLVVYPGVLILITTLSINLIGDGLRDALDPRRLLRRS